MRLLRHWTSPHVEHEEGRRGVAALRSRLGLCCTTLRLVWIWSICGYFSTVHTVTATRSATKLTQLRQKIASVTETVHGTVSIHAVHHILYGVELNEACVL